MTKWYIQQPGDQEDLGPFRPSELLERVRNGDVTRETMLRKDDSAWFVAADVGGLFEAALRPTIQHFCPQCETEIAEPPVVCDRCGYEIHTGTGITKITEHTIVDRSAASSSKQRWLNRKRRASKNDSDK